MIDWLIGLLFPEKCINCGAWDSYVCKRCQIGMWEAEPLRALDGMTCLWAYEGLVKKIIKRAKYKRQYDLLKFLIHNSKFEIQGSPVVVPVPLHKNRLRERGFNQADIIAQAFASRHSLAFNSHLLCRIKDTGHQVGRTRAERLIALKNAFIFNTEYLPAGRQGRVPNTVLLVDDVWTTGTTMRECYKVLKKAGVKKVYGLVLAR